MYKKRLFRQAKGRFLEVEELYPDYKSVKDYLQKIDGDIAKYEKRHLDENEKAFISRLMEIRESNRQVDEVDFKIRAQEERYRLKRLKADADFMYDSAVNLYQKDFYVESLDRFQELQLIYPNYKSTFKYIAKIKRKLDHDVRVRMDIQERELIMQEKDLAKQKKVESELERKARMMGEQDRIDNLEREAEFLYKSAVSLYKNKLFHQSKEKFVELEDVYPNYKSTSNYLGRIDQDQKREKNRLSQIREKELLDEMKLEKLKTSREDEKERRELEFEDEESMASLKREANFLYGSAIALYKSELYKQAEERFLEVHKSYPHYKSVDKYLRKLGSHVDLSTPEVAKKSQIVAADKKNHAQQIKRNYHTAVAFYKNKQYSSAEKKFREVQQMSPDYKSTSKYLRKIAKLMEKRKLASAGSREDSGASAGEAAKNKKNRKAVQDAIIQRQSDIENKAEAMYRKALRHYKDQNFAKAKTAFIKVEKIKPGYQSTLDYLAKIDNDINQISKSNTQRRVQKAEKEWNAVSKRKGSNIQTGSDVVKTADQSLMNKQEIKGIYKQAKILYRKNFLHPARDKFKEIENRSPGYASAKRYIKKIDRALKKKADQYDKRGTKELGFSDREIKKVKKEEKKVAKRIEKNSRERNNLMEDQNLTKKEIKQRKKILKKDLARLYDQGRKLYKQEKYLAAKSKFDAVEKLVPGYKSARKYSEKAKKKEEMTMTEIGMKSDIDQKKKVMRREIEQKERDLVKTDSGSGGIEELKQQSEGAILDEYQMKRVSEELEEEFSKKDRIARHKKDAREKMEIIKKREKLARKKIKYEQKKAEDKAKEDLKKITRKEKEDLKHLQNQVERTYEEALRLHKSSQYKMSRQKLDELDILLNDETLSPKYSRKMRKRMNKDKRDIEKNTAKFQEKKEEQRKWWKKDSKDTEKDLAKRQGMEEEYQKHKEGQLTKEQKKMKRERTDQITKLGNRIKKEEERLADEMRKFNKDPSYEPVQSERLDELKDLSYEDYKSKWKWWPSDDRVKQLRNERQRARKNFDQSIDQLYKKAVKLHKQGLIRESKVIFSEINQMKPGYKKSKSYLSKIDKQMHKASQNNTKIFSRESTLTSAHSKMAQPVYSGTMRGQSRRQGFNSFPQTNKEKFRTVTEALDSIEQGLYLNIN